MLKVTQRGKLEGQRELTAPEDRALRDAFGRWCEPGARAAGAAVVRNYQRLGAGHWFLCDCLSSGRAPALVPVLESHIRRHHEPPWPEHDPDCDFFRDHVEQRAVARSFGQQLGGRPLSLVGRLAEPAAGAVPRLTGRSYSRSRGALATMLMQLIEAAGLNVIQETGQRPTISEQFKAMRSASREVRIDERARLSTYLCTYPPALPELIAKLAHAPSGQFPITKRPHGVLIFVAMDAAAGLVMPLRGDPVPVRGEISIFGEREGHSRQSAEERRSRSPYLAACVVGFASPGAGNGRIEVLKAYLHPCAAAGHLMPVDSNLERKTLAQLLHLQTWLRAKTGVSLTVKKPVFNLAGTELEEAVGPFIPDFLVEARKGLLWTRKLIVETMGYADASYRQRKVRTQAAMAVLLPGAGIVHHDFCSPEDQTQNERDRSFWSRCRWFLTPGDTAE